MTYSMDLRERAVAAIEGGQAIAVVARRFGVQRSTVRAWRDRAASGDLTPAKPGPKSPTKLTPADEQRLAEHVAANPGITLRELRGKLSVKVAESTVCRTLRRMNLSFKKSR